MKNFLILLVPLTVLLFSLTGCRYTNGVDDYYFIVSLGLDKADDDLIKLSVQVSSTSQEDSSSSSSSTQSNNYEIYSVEAKSITEGLTILNNYLNKSTNISHCSAIVISEELAINGVKKYINTLSNNTELRFNSQVIISSGSAFDVLDNVSSSGEVFSARLFDYIENTTDYTGFTIDCPFGNFFQAIDSNYYEPIAIYTTVNDGVVQTSGIAVFKNEFMVGHLDSLDSIAHLITTNELKQCTIRIDNPFDESEKADLDLKLYKNTSTKVNIINGTPLISINIYPEAKIRSSGSSFDYIDNENIKILENSINTYLENLLNDYLYLISKEYNSDIAGFKGIYQSNFLTTEEASNGHWDIVFQDSFFEVNVSTRVISSNLFNKQ